MKIKLNLAQKVLNRRTSALRTQLNGDQSLMCKPAGCRCSLCTRPEQTTLKQTLSKVTYQTFDTNFNFSVRNAYSFVIMHLKNDDNKNPLGILIPEICVFHEGIPFNIYYSQNGHIRSYKSNNNKKLRRTDIPKIFKQIFSKSNHSETVKDLNIARFKSKLKVYKDNEYMMLSDMDLEQLCFKSRNDPLWSKLESLQNKTAVQSRHPIVHPYSSIVEYPPVLIKLANESLVGYINDKQVRQILDEESYLDFCNIKISNLLNYKHNIRITKAQFSYLRTNQGQYIFINVENLEHTNLTRSLKKREERIQREQIEKNNRIILTPRREQRIKYMENSPMVRVIQEKMDQQFNEQLRQFDFNSEQFSQNQEAKNEMAFKRLHPLITVKYKDMLQSSNFTQIKDKILGKKKRRSLINSKKARFFPFYQPEVLKLRHPLKSISTFQGISHQSKNPYFRHNRRLTTTTDMSAQSAFGHLHSQQDRRYSKQ